MKILLIGEYSNVHATLAEGLRQLGHQVMVVSNGDFWKDYPRDIDLSRKPGKLGGAGYMLKLYRILPELKGYDIVQLINPLFLELKAERILPIYKYLRRQNRKIILGGFGMDYYWVHECITRKPLRYSDFNIGDKIREDEVAVRDREDWLHTPKGRLNQFIAGDCDGIVTGLYENWACYQPNFPDKTVFIPYPVKCKKVHLSGEIPEKIKFFIGISKNRSRYKGTDIMLMAAQNIIAKYPDKTELKTAQGIPFAEYTKMLNGCDAILDQLYSYTPSMNPLEAMSRGIICIGGGEPENYEIIHENELRPIINVRPNYESVYEELEKLVLHPERIPDLKQQSIEYISRHHDYLKVARQYEELYQHVMEKEI